MTVSFDIISKLKEEYGDAFYLLDSKQFQDNYYELKSIFEKKYPRFNIAYSYKTNYIPKLCKIVNSLGGYAEVVSEMEMELALRCGVAPNKIIWNGPIKKHKMIEKLLMLGGTVNVDSVEEARYIKSIALQTEKVLKIGIRCNFDVNDGVTSRFGIDIYGKDFEEVISIVKTSRNIKLLSFQCHYAKRQVEFWPARAMGMIEVIEHTGIIPDRIDIGGGLFGKMPDELKAQFSSKVPEYEEYADAAASILNSYFMNKEKMPELIIEPGSALVGDCLKFAGTIKTIKCIRGKMIATVMGSQKNISMSNVNPPIEILHIGEDVEEYENLDIVGFTCIEGDVLYKNYTGKLAREDMILISNCGSYSIVMKPPFILPNFPILDISSGDVEIIKRKEEFEDIFKTYNF